MASLYWEIRGYDSLKKMFEKHVPVGCFTERQIQDLLKASAAKEGLTLEVIVGAYAGRQTKISNNLLNVQKDGPYPRYMCGQNPYLVAAVVDENLEPIVCRMPGQS